MNGSLVKWSVIIAILLVWAGLLTGVTASSQEGGAPIVVTGNLEVLTTDNFTQGTVTTSYFLQADNGPDYELQFGGGPPADLSTGQRVTVEGHLDGNTLWVDTLTPDPNVITPLPDDPRNVLILLVNLLDATSNQYTPQQIAGLMYTGTRSVADLYRQASLGRVNFVADGDSNGAPDIVGPFTINYSAAQNCDYIAWARAAESAAQQAGVVLWRYRYRLFVLPHYSDLPACNWIGAANIGCGNSCRTWIAAADSPMVYVHELGHNLNLSHAGTDPDNDGVIDSFNDLSDPMGMTSGWRLFNAPHVDQVNWYTPYPGSVINVTQSGIYHIDVLDASPMTDPPGSPRILKLPKPNTQEYYYLSYRQPTGYDADLDPLYTQGVNIHGYRGHGDSVTAFVSALTDGATFTDTTNGLLQVTQVSHSSDHVTVDISLCTSVPTTVTLLPSSRMVQPGGVSSYTVAVTNRDSAACPATTFTLNYLGVPGGTLTPTSLNLGGGVSGSALLQVNATAGLASDLYAIEVQTSDSDNVPPAHPISSQGSASFIVDGNPPTVPTGLYGAVDAQGWTTLTWNASSDALTSVQAYIVKRNDTEIGRTAGLSFVDNTAPQGDNTYTVAAIDAVGNVSPPSTPTVLICGTSPIVIITAPADGATFTTGQTITFAGTATDPRNGDLTASLSWTSSIDGAIGSGGSFSRALSAGVHTIQAQVTNSKGSTSTAVLMLHVINPTTVTFDSVGTEDGWVLESTETSNVGGSIKANDTNRNALLLGDTHKKQQYKSILSFDTSSLPDNAIITAATLRLQRGTPGGGSSPFDTHGALLADIGVFNGNAALETTDFQAPATAVGVTSLSNAPFNGAWSEGTLDVNGLAAIDKTGRTQFRLYFNLDDDDDSTSDYLGYYAGEYGTAASRPQLVVTYR